MHKKHKNEVISNLPGGASKHTGVNHAFFCRAAFYKELLDFAQVQPGSTQGSHKPKRTEEWATRRLRRFYDFPMKKCLEQI